MRTDKAFVTLGGTTLLARAIELAHTLNSEFRIVGDPEKYSQFGPCIVDIFPHCGPLGGIHAALRSSKADLNLMLAVDLPFITPALLQFLIARARDSAALVTICRAAHGLQPLCAVYRREFADPAEKALCAGRYKIDALFEEATTLVIEEHELQGAGFSPQVFRNLNTPEDFAGVKQKAEP